MTWHFTRDVAEYLARAGDFLASRPVEHTVLLTLAEALRAERSTESATHFFGWHQAGPAVTGALLATPPRPLLLSRLPLDAIESLVPALRAAGFDGDVHGVSAGVREAEAFAGHWRVATGAAAEVRMRMRLYRLDQLLPPDPAPAGRGRLAGPADRETLLVLAEEFAVAVGEPGIGAAVVDSRLAAGAFVLWEVDGVPVSLAAVTPPVAGQARVGAVYTPPAHRGHGYAAAATAMASAWARDRGVSEVLLFTDLANPTSNRIYHRLGYRPVSDRLTVEFTA